MSTHYFLYKHYASSNKKENKMSGTYIVNRQKASAIVCLIRNILHNTRAILALRSRIQIMKQIVKLEIEVAGESDDGVPYIKLMDGTVFYGLKPSLGDLFMYNLCNLIKQPKIPKKCIAVAQSIVISYFGGGLKCGGPSKQFCYKVKRGDCVAEMGAFLGFYAIRLSKEVGPEGRVIAIEPIPRNVLLLKRNIEVNGITNITVVTSGVWETNSKMSFGIGKSGGQSNTLIDIKQKESGEVLVDVATLDTIFNQQSVRELDFVIIQLNGVEIEALKGLNTIPVKNLAIAARYRRPDGTRPEPVIKQLLITRGYKKIHMEKGGFIFASL